MDTYATFAFPPRFYEADRSLLSLPPVDAQSICLMS